jgi:hypothetical protein
MVLPFMATWLQADHGFVLPASRSVSPAARAMMDMVRLIEREVCARNTALADEFLRGHHLRT